jgi:hypothetical protein
MTPLERIAHDVICIVKYGSPGGSANTADVKRVAEYLDRMRPLPEQPKIAIPKPAVAAPPKVVLPAIRLPGT